MHTVVGAGKGEGSMDAGNMLKPMLARGELRMVGATTLDEFRENIEKDPALERRFQQVLVGEPTVEDTVAILRGLKGRYEAHHQVQISDAALVAAATLSDRYITARFLPDKAIDLVDEAGVAAADGDRLPAGGDRRAAAQRRPAADGGDGAGQGERRGLGGPPGGAAPPAGRRRPSSLAALTARWEAEKGGLNRVGELKKQLDELRGQAERAQRDNDLETASRLMYAEIPALERELAEARRRRPSTATRWSRSRSARTTSPRWSRLDRHPGRAAARGRDGEAAADGGASSAGG